MDITHQQQQQQREQEQQQHQYQQIKNEGGMRANVVVVDGSSQAERQLQFQIQQDLAVEQCKRDLQREKYLKLFWILFGSIIFVITIVMLLFLIRFQTAPGDTTIPPSSTVVDNDTSTTRTCWNGITLTSNEDDAIYTESVTLDQALYSLEENDVLKYSRSSNSNAKTVLTVTATMSSSSFLVAKTTSLASNIVQVYSIQNITLEAEDDESSSSSRATVQKVVLVQGNSASTDDNSSVNHGSRNFNNTSFIQIGGKQITANNNNDTASTASFLNNESNDDDDDDDIITSIAISKTSSILSVDGNTIIYNDSNVTSDTAATAATLAVGTKSGLVHIYQIRLNYENNTDDNSTSASSTANFIQTITMSSTAEADGTNVSSSSHHEIFSLSFDTHVHDDILAIGHRSDHNKLIYDNNTTENTSTINPVRTGYVTVLYKTIQQQPSLPSFMSKYMYPYNKTEVNSTFIELSEAKQTSFNVSATRTTIQTQPIVEFGASISISSIPTILQKTTTATDDSSSQSSSYFTSPRIIATTKSNMNATIQYYRKIYTTLAVGAPVTTTSSRYTTTDESATTTIEEKEAGITINEDITTGRVYVYAITTRIPVQSSTEIAAIAATMDIDGNSNRGETISPIYACGNSNNNTNDYQQQSLCIVTGNRCATATEVSDVRLVRIFHGTNTLQQQHESTLSSSYYLTNFGTRVQLSLGNDHRSILAITSSSIPKPTNINNTETIQRSSSSTRGTASFGGLSLFLDGATLDLHPVVDVTHVYYESKSASLSYKNADAKAWTLRDGTPIRSSIDFSSSTMSTIDGGQYILVAASDPAARSKGTSDSDSKATVTTTVTATTNKVDDVQLELYNYNTFGTYEKVDGLDFILSMGNTDGGVTPAIAMIELQHSNNAAMYTSSTDQSKSTILAAIIGPGIITTDDDYQEDLIISSDGSIQQQKYPIQILYDVCAQKDHSTVEADDDDDDEIMSGIRSISFISSVIMPLLLILTLLLSCEFCF